ncbi:MAG: SPFH domain-containing protein [Treponema sp.]|nr:SPFH domain-containing protein [Spirochaetia bacterium]MDD7458837.1 SPFH domain-containing protein [Spirochaetales bacterium]MDY5811970.1 SPFH domain-containing protein [Treponema sp.]
MAFFKKNPNEANYAGGEKHFVDVIKNSGNGNLLVWLCPEEDFNTGSTLIVQEGEEAVFYKNGTVEQIFSAGKYVLDTNNYPFLSRLVNAFSGGISAFNCKVYFVRKASSQEILWGTPTPIQVRDPVQMIMTSVMARGSLKINVENSAKFLAKLLGNNISFMEQAEILNFFKTEIIQHVKSLIAKYIKSSGEEILGICSDLDILVQKITPEIQGILSEYGTGLLRFVIDSLDIPEDDPGRQKLEAAYATKRESQIYGDDYQKFVSREVLTNISNNNGGAAIASLGAGLGMAAGVGNAFGQMSGQVMSSSGQNTYAQQVNCPSCNSVNAAGAKFCSNCGAAIPQVSFCSNCGQKLAAGAKFCSGCGTKIS